MHDEVVKWFLPYMYAEDCADKLEEGKAAAKELVDKFGAAIG